MTAPSSTIPAGRDELISIGRLADETGVSTDRLRIWERRYGRPRPQRLPSGHRRYPRAEVGYLRCVVDLIGHGKRPGDVLKLDPDKFEALFRVTCRPRSFEGAEEWLELVAELQPRQLETALLEEAKSMELLDFLEERLTPFLRAIGVRWAEGRLDVRHEHMAARVVAAVLSALRTRAGTTVQMSRRAVLATLPEEQHGLALGMAALVCAQAGVAPLVLGIQTPVDDIVKTAAQARADLVAISVSPSAPSAITEAALRRLRGALADDVELAVGGARAAGGRRTGRGIRHFDDLRSFAAWLAEAQSPARAGTR